MVQRPTAFLNPGITFCFLRGGRLGHSSLVSWNLSHPSLSQSPQQTHSVNAELTYSYLWKRCLELENLWQDFIYYSYFSLKIISSVLCSCVPAEQDDYGGCTSVIRMIFGHPLHLQLCWLRHNSKKVVKILRDTYDFQFSYFKEKSNSS